MALSPEQASWLPKALTCAGFPFAIPVYGDKIVVVSLGRGDFLPLVLLGYGLMIHGGMGDNQRKAELSFAYLSALCAMAGYTCQRGPEPDEDSIDATVRGRHPGRSALDIQLKATSSPVLAGDGLHFRLHRKNYDDLRVDRSIQIILVVLELPDRPDAWLECRADELVLRRRAWWDSLWRFPEIETESKVIVIPESQRFDLEAMSGLMDRIRRRVALKE